MLPLAFIFLLCLPCSGKRNLLAEAPSSCDSQQLQDGRAKPFEPTAVQLICNQIQTSKGCDDIEYAVTTADGVQLPLHRIVNQYAPAVLVQHGMMGTSADWLQLGAESMPFILWRAGFDVWLGNTRGNDYAEQLQPLESDQWEFSFEDSGRFDFPALVEGVLQHSGQSTLTYVGYSLGALQAFVGLSEQSEEWQKKIRLYVALAPVAFMESMRGGIFDWNYLSKFGYSVVGGRRDPFRRGIKRTCKAFCRTCAQRLYGGSSFISKHCQDFFNYNPAGTSTKNLRHMTQYIFSGYPHRFDYGAQGNLDSYGGPVPLPICLERIRVPTAMIYGSKDWLADPYGVARLEQELPFQYREQNVAVQVDTREHKHNITMHAYSMEVVDFGHVDFIWSQEAVSRVYNVVLDLLEKNDKQIEEHLCTPRARSTRRFIYLAYCHSLRRSKCPMKIDRILAKIDRVGCDGNRSTCALCGFSSSWGSCPSDEAPSDSTLCHSCFCKTWCGMHALRRKITLLPSVQRRCVARCSKWLGEYETHADADPTVRRCAGDNVASAIKTCS